MDLLVVLVEADVGDDNLGLEVPDLDTGLGGGAEPVAVGGEDEGVDDLVGVELVEELGLGEVPEHGLAVLATGGTEGAVRGDGHAVEVTGVANEVGLEAAVGEVPHLDDTVPAGGNDEGAGVEGGEAHAGDPLGVLVLSDGVLALTKSVPELDGAVAGSGHDLAVVEGEGDGENILLVANKAAGGGAGVDVPETEGTVPGAGEAELAVAGDDDILNEVVVAGQGTASEAHLLVVGEGPHNNALVTTGRENHVGVLMGGGDGGHLQFVEQLNKTCTHE